VCSYAAPPGYFDDDVLRLFAGVAVPPAGPGAEPAAEAAEAETEVASGGREEFGAPDSRWFLLGAPGSGSEARVRDAPMCAHEGRAVRPWEHPARS
jgi:hypothetical protein